jgi:hypothetical protein
MEELVCPVLQSYLIVTQDRPDMSEANYSTLQVNVLLYSDLDNDGVAGLGKNAWKGAEASKELKQIVIKTRLWLVQRMDNAENDQEWQETMYNLISICANNAVFSVIFSPPSTSLQAFWSTKCVSAVAQALFALNQLSITVFLMSSKDDFPHFRRTLEEMDLLTPQTDRGLRVEEGSLLVSAWKTLKCTVCRRLVLNPRINQATDELICRQCMRDRGLPDSFPPPELDLFKQILSAIPITCRCGVQTTANELDKHTLSCETKEFFCVAHKRDFKKDQYFAHLIEEHFDFVREKAAFFVNRD